MKKTITYVLTMLVFAVASLLLLATLGNIGQIELALWAGVGVIVGAVLYRSTFRRERDVDDRHGAPRSSGTTTEPS